MNCDIVKTSLNIIRPIKIATMGSIVLIIAALDASINWSPYVNNKNATAVGSKPIPMARSRTGGSIK